MEPETASYYKAEILCDSISPDAVRLTTFEVTFPRFILAEVNTHRILSRNSASSRAIPSEKIIEKVIENPFVPKFNKRVKGMGVGEALNLPDHMQAGGIWIEARDAAVNAANKLINLDVDKSRVNRLLEPFMWHTALITATDWNNFFALRTHKDAQPEFRIIATMMNEALVKAAVPDYCGYGEYHLPLIKDPERQILDPEAIKKVSVGRCARVSYLTHDGQRDPQADIELHDRLLTSGHMSPFEHVAKPVAHGGRNANFAGWKQYRKEIPNEDDYSKVLVA